MPVVTTAQNEFTREIYRRPLRPTGRIRTDSGRFTVTPALIGPTVVTGWASPAHASGFGESRVPLSRTVSSMNIAWGSLDLRHFEALAAVARARSFRAAARRLGYTQSAVSQQIATLERVVGFRLVERPSAGRSLELTAAGARLLVLSRTLGAAIEEAQAELEELEARRPVRAALDLPLPQAALAAATLRARHQDLVVELSATASGEECLRVVQLGLADLAIVRLPTARAAAFDDVPREILRSPYVVALPASSPLACADTPLGPEDLAAQSLIVTEREREAASWGAASPALVVSDLQLAVEAVAAGAGVALVPAIVLEGTAGRVVARPLRVELPVVRLGARVGAGDRAAAGRELVETIVAVTAPAFRVPPVLEAPSGPEHNSSSGDQVL